MKKIILLLLIPAIGWANDHCKGTTKKGEPCHSVIINKEGYCGAHDPSSKHCSFIKKDGSQCRVVTKGELCRFHKTKNQ